MLESPEPQERPPIIDVVAWESTAHRRADARCSHTAAPWLGYVGRSHNLERWIVTPGDRYETSHIPQRPGCRFANRRLMVQSFDEIEASQRMGPPLSMGHRPKGLAAQFFARVTIGVDGCQLCLGDQLCHLKPRSSCLVAFDFSSRYRGFLGCWNQLIHLWRLNRRPPFRRIPSGQPAHRRDQGCAGFC